MVDDVRMEGELEKRNLARWKGNSWKRYRFVLRDRLLVYYHCSHGSNHNDLKPCKGSINLGTAKDVRPARASAKNIQDIYVLHIVPRSGHAVQLRADTKQDFEKWLAALVDAFNGTGTGKRKTIELNNSKNKPLRRRNTILHRIRQLQNNAKGATGSFRISKSKTSLESSEKSSNQESQFELYAEITDDVRMREPLPNTNSKWSTVAGKRTTTWFSPTIYTDIEILKKCVSDNNLNNNNYDKINNLSDFCDKSDNNKTDSVFVNKENDIYDVCSNNNQDGSLNLKLDEFAQNPEESILYQRSLLRDDPNQHIQVSNAIQVNSNSKNTHIPQISIDALYAQPDKLKPTSNCQLNKTKSNFSIDICQKTDNSLIVENDFYSINKRCSKSLTDLNKIESENIYETADYLENKNESKQVENDIYSKSVQIKCSKSLTNLHQDIQTEENLYETADILDDKNKHDCVIENDIYGTPKNDVENVNVENALYSECSNLNNKSEVRDKSEETFEEVEYAMPEEILEDTSFLSTLKRSELTGTLRQKRPQTVVVFAQKSRELFRLIRGKSRKKKPKPKQQNVFEDQQQVDYADYLPLNQNPTQQQQEQPNLTTFQNNPEEPQTNPNHNKELVGALPTVGKTQFDELQTKLELRKQKSLGEVSKISLNDFKPNLESTVLELEDYEKIDYFKTDPVSTLHEEIPPELPPRRFLHLRKKGSLNQSDGSPTPSIQSTDQSNSIDIDIDLSVKKLIEKFELPNGEVTLRRNHHLIGLKSHKVGKRSSVELNLSGGGSGSGSSSGSGDVKGGALRPHSDELSTLLEQLAMVTFAPLREPGQTISLPVNDVTKKQKNNDTDLQQREGETDDEWLARVPIRRRRHSEPDYDVPRPHRRSSASQKTDLELADAIPATRFLGPALPQMNIPHIHIEKSRTTRPNSPPPDPPSITPDSLTPAPIQNKGHEFFLDSLEPYNEISTIF